VRLRALTWLAISLTWAPASARAIQYETFVSIDTEEDLYDLLVTSQISEASFEALLQLHQVRVALNHATREELYRLPNLDYADVDRIIAHLGEQGPIRSVNELHEAGVLEARVASSLAAFVLLQSSRERREGARGFVRAQLRWSGRHDRLPPSAALQARVRAAGRLDAGAAAVLTRNQTGRVRWDPIRDGLSVEPERPRLLLPKAYVAWNAKRWLLLAGTYRIGFGQRLTFDVTNQVSPNGVFGDYELRRDNELGLRCRRSAGELPASPCQTAPARRVTPDFTWTNRLTGLALGAKRAAMGPGWLQAYLWGSFQLHRVPQSEVFLAERCADPRRDEDESCRAPQVFVREGSELAPAPAISSSSLRAVLGEGLGGAHVQYFWRPRALLGATGYAAVPKWRVEGAALDFQESARRPFGGAFGALGVHAALGSGRHDLFAELARSFDGQVGGGGGYAAFIRSVTELQVGELEASARVYGPKYANPYARPVSAADELDGLAARDETGVRVRSTMRLRPAFELRWLVDGWRRLSSGALRARVFARGEVQLSPGWSWALWLDLRSAGLGLLAATRLAYEPIRELIVSCQLQHRRSQAALTPPRAQHDLAAVLSFTGRPVDKLRLRIRIRYDVQDLQDNERLPHTLWVYIDAPITLRERDTLRLRYDLRAHLDRRPATLQRVPNPEHWLWVEYVFRY
jgi:hypothetical protein